MKPIFTKRVVATVLWIFAATCSPTLAQQFNSDN